MTYKTRPGFTLAVLPILSGFQSPAICTYSWKKHPETGTPLLLRSGYLPPQSEARGCTKAAAQVGRIIPNTRQRDAPAKGRSQTLDSKVANGAKQGKNKPILTTLMN